MIRVLVLLFLSAFVYSQLPICNDFANTRIACVPDEYANIPAAVAVATQPGDVIYLNQASFTISEITLSADGTQGNPISIRNYPFVDVTIYISAQDNGFTVTGRFWEMVAENGTILIANNLNINTPGRHFLKLYESFTLKNIHVTKRLTSTDPMKIIFGPESSAARSGDGFIFEGNTFDKVQIETNGFTLNDHSSESPLFSSRFKRIQFLSNNFKNCDIKLGNAFHSILDGNYFDINSGIDSEFDQQLIYYNSFHDMMFVNNVFFVHANPTTYAKGIFGVEVEDGLNVTDFYFYNNLFYCHGGSPQYTLTNVYNTSENHGFRNNFHISNNLLFSENSCGKSLVEEKVPCGDSSSCLVSANSVENDYTDRIGNPNGWTFSGNDVGQVDISYVCMCGGTYPTPYFSPIKARIAGTLLPLSPTEDIRGLTRTTFERGPFLFITPVCSTTCVNAQCVSTDKCECDLGYVKGSDDFTCVEASNENTTCSPPCSEHGTCDEAAVNATCKCKIFYVGETCDTLDVIEWVNTFFKFFKMGAATFYVVVGVLGLIVLFVIVCFIVCCICCICCCVKKKKEGVSREMENVDSDESAGSADSNESV